MFSLVFERFSKAESRPAPAFSTDEETARIRRQLAVLLIVGAVVRVVLAVWLGNGPPTIWDAKDYDRLAVGLVENGSYADEQGRLISLRPPLYPAVVAVIYKLCGTDNYVAVSLFHAALSLVTVVLTYRLGVEVYTPRVGLWAATVVCFYPSLLAYNQFFLSEVLFTFFVTASALLSLRVLKSASLGQALLLGLCLSLGALTRSVLWLFTPLLCLGLVACGQATLGRRFVAAALTLIAFAATIAPWAYRNTRLHETLTFIDVMGGRNVMMGNYEYTPLDRSWATIELRTGEESWHRVLAKHTDNYSELTQGQIDKAAMRYGVIYFFTHPWQSLQRSTVKFFNFWQLEREIIAGLRSGMFGDAPTALTIAIAALVCGAYVMTVFAGIFGAAVVPPSSRAVHATLLFWMIFPWALHAVAFAHSRYHLPLIPIVAVYAATAGLKWREVLAERRNLAFAGATLACGLLAASWVREFLVLDLPHLS